MNGILLIDKPAGPTSHDIVARLRRHMGVRQIGHAGTLDPFATGLLVCLVGRATKLTQFIVGHRKTYRVQAVLNEMTDSYDRTGRIISRTDRIVSASDVAAAVEGFPERYDQTPPPYSAKKVGGTAAHKLARQGKSPSLRPETIEIYQLSVVQFSFPRLTLFAEVSSGTYIRSLIVDLAKRLGTVAHVAELHRLASGPFDVCDAIGLDDVLNLPPTDIPRRILAMQSALTDLPTVHLNVEDATAFVNGRWLGSTAAAGLVAVHVGDEFLGVGRIENGGLRPVRVISR